MLIKRAVLRAVLPATTAEDSKYYLTAIQIHPDGRCVATDGQVLLIATDQHPEADDQFPSKGMPEFKGSPEGPICVDRAVVGKILTAMPKKAGRQPILEHAQLGVMEGGAMICATDLTAACVVDLPAEGQQKFPTYARVLPKADRPELQVSLAVHVLETLIKATKAIQGEWKSVEGGVITFGISADPKDQGTVPLDHAFTFNGAASGIEGETICEHEGCGRRHDSHTGGPDGKIIGVIGVQMQGDGITLTGAAMPCRTD